MDIPAQLTEHLLTATTEAFEMMVGRAVEPLPAGTATPVWPLHVAATVAFGGHRNGVVCIHSSGDAAREIAGAMLGMEPAEVNGEMPDAMGEVANLVAGAFRTKLAAEEPASVITVPTVTVGSDFSTHTASASVRGIYPFKMGDESVLVELVLMDR